MTNPIPKAESSNFAAQNIVLQKIKNLIFGQIYKGKFCGIRQMRLPCQ
jgi:hypothetical protein